MFLKYLIVILHLVSNCIMQNVIDWKKCVLCQSSKNESLQCPAKSKRTDVGSGYKSLATNLQIFHELNPNIIDVNLDILDEGNGVEECLRRNNACWHKSCALKYNNTKLKRAKKRFSDVTVDEAREVYPKRKKTPSECGHSKEQCFFCDKPDNNEPMHKVSTLGINNRVRDCALLLQDNELLAKLSAGDMVAIDAVYHKTCLTALYNRARSAENKVDAKHHADKVIHGIILAELVAYIEERRDESDVVSVLKLKDLSSMYSSRLKQFGYVDTTIHSTRLKERILVSIPDLKAYPQGRDTYLAFDSEIGIALRKALESNTDTEANHLAKAAEIVRKEMLSMQLNFDGEFKADCQEESTPSSLKSLVKMILYGPNIQNQMKIYSSQAALTIAQLLQFNCYSRKPEDNSNYVRHNKDRETPLPIYIGVSLHAQTRKRDLVDSLSKLGISISYDRVLSISTDVGNAVCRRFEEEGVVCPTKLRKDLFTTAAIDNIDHNPSSNTAQGAFHGTGISLFQNMDSTNTGQERDVTVMECGGQLSTKSICCLPDWYAEVPPCILRNTAETAPKANIPQREQRPCEFEKAKKEEYEWLRAVERVTRTTQDNNQPEPECSVTWSGYHSIMQQGDCSTLPAISSIFPLFSYEAKSVAMIRHAMNVIKSAIEFLNPGQIPVITVDQPLYSVAKQIQWNWPDTHGEQQFVIIPGGLHIEMATLSFLGDLLEDSGWTSALVQANIASPGVANAFLKGSNVKRARHAHEVTASALFCLLNKAFHMFKDKGLIAQSMSFDDWCSDHSTLYPQFQFWYTTLQLELIYLLFVRSLRESNFSLYISVLHKIVPWFFSLNHINYARWLPVHLQDIQVLQHKLPQVYQELNKGGFIVKKSSNAFSAIAIDQAHEQNNALVKGDGGAVGLTESPEALRRWMVAGPEIARMVTEFEASFSGIEDETQRIGKHHETSKGLQSKFAKEVQSLVTVVEEMGNPFTEKSKDLLVLDTRDLAAVDVIKTVKEIEALGKSQFDNFQKERLENQEKNVCDPIKKNKLALFKTPSRKPLSKEKQQISSLKTDCALFSRLFISCQTRNEDLDDFFQHENQGCPPSISLNGKLRISSKKSDLLDCLPFSSLEEGRQKVEAMILDGAAIINMLKPTNAVKTFQDYSDYVLIPHLKSQLHHVNRLDVVFDEYIANSLKQTTRDKRGKGVRRRVQASTLVPKNWPEFLRVDLNKKELFYFLAEQVPLVDFGVGKQVFITKGEQVLTSPSNDDTSRIAPCDHEEADTRVFVHVADAVQSGYQKIGIRTVDTDVVAIGISAIQSLPEIEELWIFFGTGVNRRRFSVHEIAASLGPNKARALPMFHAFTGCDTVSCFLGKGKKTAWQTWLQYDDVTSAFLHFMSCRSLSDESLEKIERFVVLLYDRTSTKLRVNDARKQLFAQKGRPMDAIPPTQAALIQHLRRAVYQGCHCWGQALTSIMSLPCPSQWGWRESQEVLLPLWSTLPDISSSSHALVKCGCKKGCKNHCTCRKSSLQCTALCACEGHCVED